MFTSKDTATEVLNFIIQYADDIDVGYLLKNCGIRIYKRQPHVDVINDYLMSNKEWLLLKLCLENNKYSYFVDVTTLDEIEVEKRKEILLIKHLKAISECYNSYMAVTGLKDTKKKYSKNTLGLIINNDFVSIESYKYENNLPREINKKILHLIINSYTQCKCYYALNKDSITKIDFEKNEQRKTQYKIFSAKRTSYIISEKTGLRINIGIPIKFHGFKSDTDLKNINKDYKNFEKLNNAIINALNKEPIPCHWCYPDKNNNPRKYVCDNCKEILSLLNEQQAKKANKKSIIKVEKEIRKFNYKNYANAMTLRKRRKQYLEYVLVNCKENTKMSNADVIYLLELIDNGYGTIH